MRNKLISILLFGLLTSCNFNKALFKPTKLPSTAKGYTSMTASDTIKAKFSGENHQPVFMKNGKEVTDLEYTIESISFKSSNGNNLNGWFMKPKNGTPTITLLQLHGNEGSIHSQSMAMVPLAKKGFQIFVFDYSGYGFSEGAATRTTVLADALSALDFLKKRQETAHTKMVIYGQSMGGHLSAVVATERQKEIDGLVIEGAFSSYKDIVAYRLPVLGRILTKQGYSATQSIKDFHKPVLVIHSTEDKEVPFSMGKKIFDTANSPKEFFEVKQCHICATSIYADEISTKIKKMVETK